MDVTLRRRFGFEGGQITAYEDEHLLDHDRGRAASSRILATEIERPRVGPMRDIVATIQPEQDVIVRADVAETVCVQGAPGTGKTAVGLHRAAYLLYTFADRLRRGGVLVIGPNSAFLSYIAAVLPALGEVDVRQVTLDELVGARVDRAQRGPRRRRDAEGRRAAGAGAGERGVRRAGRPDRAAGRADRVAAVARRRRRAGRRRARAPRPRRALRRRTRDAAAAAGARRPDPDGGGRRVARRPHAGCRRPVRAGAQDGHPAVAGRRPGAAGAAAAERPPTCWPRPPTGSSARRSSRCWSGTSRRAGPPPRAGRSPTRSSSTRPPTWSTASRASGTSSWTRRRTSRRCSCEPSAGAARPEPPPSSATSRRAPHPGRRPTGRRPCATSASRPPTSRCCAAATACPPTSSTSRAGCCRTSRRASRPPSPCARTSVCSRSCPRPTSVRQSTTRYAGCLPCPDRSASSWPTTSSSGCTARWRSTMRCSAATSPDRV